MAVRLLTGSDADLDALLALQQTSRAAALSANNWPTAQVGYVQWTDRQMVRNYLAVRGRFVTADFNAGVLRSALIVDPAGTNWHIVMRLELPNLANAVQASIFVDWVHVVRPLLQSAGILTISGDWPHGKMASTAKFLTDRGAVITPQSGQFAGVLDTMTMPVSALAAVA